VIRRAATRLIDQIGGELPAQEDILEDSQKPCHITSGSVRVFTGIFILIS
jgi:hypothetical protein